MNPFINKNIMELYSQRIRLFPSKEICEKYSYDITNDHKDPIDETGIIRNHNHCKGGDNELVAIEMYNFKEGRCELHISNYGRVLLLERLRMLIEELIIKEFLS